MPRPSCPRELAMSILLLVIAVLGAALLLSLCTGEAAAGGTGDWPPPSSGDWYVTQTTTVWSEAIVMQGLVYIYAPLQMNLCNLTFDCTYDGQYYLYVLSTGSLTFSNGNITSKDKSNHYRFIAYNSTTIRNSELSEALYGLEIYTGAFTLTDSEVFDMEDYGVQMTVWYAGKSSPLIRGNTFANNDGFGLYIYLYASLYMEDYPAVMTGNIIIKDNRFLANLGGGVYIYRYMYAWWSMEETMLTNITIEGNTMVSNRGQAIYVYTYMYNYQGADHGKITSKGAINVNNNTIKDNSAWVTIYYQNSMSIYYGSDALIDSDINMVGNKITGNKDSYTVYLYNSIYSQYGHDAKVRIDLRIEGNDISKNGGHAFYVTSYSNTDRGEKGVCTNDGDILFRDNTIQDNLGSGVYLYRIAAASYSAYCSITGDIIFNGNTISRNQGYGGVYIYSYAEKSRGDPNASAHVRGEVRFINNTFTGNLGYGAYVYAYSRSYYGSDADVRGDVLFRGNTLNGNSGYGGYVYYDAYKEMGAENGVARVVSNATFRGNTLSKNSGYHGFYYHKHAACYSSSHAILNGTVTAEGNTIEDNKGYGFYFYADLWNYLSTQGNTEITGDIWVRDNQIRRNEGGGVYIECYSSSWRSRSASIFQNVTFERNTVTSNGYSGLLISLGASSDRATAGDTRIKGDVSYVGNNVSNNLYDGIYLYRYAYAGYTDSTDVILDGDVLLERNTVNGNYGYAAFIYHWIYNSQSGLGGSSQLKADYIARNNTMSGNLNWATMYLYRYVSGYYTGLVELDSDLLVEDNTVSNNRGIGILAVDYCYQFYYGGSGVPDRGNVTQRGRMEVMRNTVTNNAGTGIHLNSTIDAQVRQIEAAPHIERNVINYNYGSYGLYCDLRDVTHPIVVANNTMEHNTVWNVALLSNSGTAPDVMLRDNRIRHNTVQDTTVGLTIGYGNFNATIQRNNVSYNDAVERILYVITTGRLTIDANHFIGNLNATETLMAMGSSATSVVSITGNVLRDNEGNGMTLYCLGDLTVEGNTVVGNGGNGIKATTDVTLEVPRARIYIRQNRVEENGGNGVWSQGINVLEVTDNTLTGNGLAGLRVNALKEMPIIEDDTIDGNKWGVILAGDKLAPLTQVYAVEDLVITGSTLEGFYAEDLTVQLRNCRVTGSAVADLAVRRAHIDCYSSAVGYMSGNVYEEGWIRVWWRIDIDVKWQNGVPVPGARVLMASQATNETYRELETDLLGHIPYFNAEEWSMVDMARHPWSPYAMTASKAAESTTQVERVDRSRNILIVLRDLHVPSVTISEPVEGALLNRSTVALVAAVSDGGSGLLSVRMRIDSDPWTELGKPAAIRMDLDVPDGTHTITVQAEDVAGMRGNATVNLTIDTVLPKLVLLAPKDGLLTNVTLVQVEGRVMEPDLEVWVNNLPQAIRADNSFRESVRLYEGPNIVRVLARDRAGNTRLLLANVTLDTVPPPLAIDSPVDRFLTREPLLTVLGRTEAGATVTGLGSTTAAGPDGTFELSVDLTEGENLLLVTARDAAGNGVTVALHVRLDTTPPWVTIDAPAEGKPLLTKDDRVRVAGRVEMEEGLVLSVGGGFALPTNGSYEQVVDLVEGSNLIVVTARDRAGNEAHVNRTVIRRTQPPTLAVTRPARDYLETNEARYLVEGTTATDVDLTIEGVPVAVLPNGTFSGFAQLTTGENVVVVEVRDALGNVAKVVVHIILDTEPPSLVVESPYSGTTYDEAVNVTGRTDVGAALTINGIDVPVDARGRFDLTIHLRYGVQNITVVAKDVAGNDAKVDIQVTRLRSEGPPSPPTPPPSVMKGGGGTLLVALIIAAAAAGGYVIYKRRKQLG